MILALFFSGCTGTFDNSLWHQQYQPIENLQALSFAQSAFSEAQQQYGNSEYPVRNIHIRQSIVRKDISLLARADIVNFNNLARQILLAQANPPKSLIWNGLDKETREYVEQSATGQFLSVEGQQKIVEGLNKLIRSERFYQELFSGKNIELEEQYRSIRKKDIADRKKFIRNFLTNHFSGSLLPIPARRHVLEGVEICECLEPEKDVCILYVSKTPGDSLFYPQLAHEVFHLLSPDCYDWYVEGLSNMFSEFFSAKTGYSWQPVLHSFYAGEKTDPYAISYFMMRDINKVAGPYLRNFLNFTVWSDTSQTKKHVDVDSWLKTIPADTRARVIDIIRSYAPSLTAHKGLHNSFYLP